MLSLNLISRELKKEINLKRVSAVIKKMSAILIVAAALFAIILSTAKIILRNNLNQALERANLVADAENPYIAKIKNINSKIIAAQSIQNDYIPWTLTLENLTNLTPRGITYSYLKIDKIGGQASLRGLADMRENLLELKNNLNNSNLFSEVKSPMENILQKENINFSIDMKLNIDKIKKITN